MKALDLSWLSSRFEPALESQRLYFDHDLESLRGFAALTVFWYHLFGLTPLDPKLLLPDWLAYIQASRGAVLVFFVISGYVIGLTNRGQYSGAAATHYLKRRTIRLYPIYLIAIACGALVVGAYSWRTLLGNLVFLQNFQPYFHYSIPPLPGVSPIWSLNYEVIYYLGFLVVWALRPPWVATVSTLGLLSLLGWFIPALPPFLVGYATGAIFWLSGLLLAWRVAPAAGEDSRPFPLIGCLLLLFATEHLNPFKLFLNGIGHPCAEPAFVSFADLDFLPVCFLLVGAMTRRLVLPGFLLALSALLPAASIVMLLVKHQHLAETRWVCGITFTVAGWLCLVLNSRPVFPRWLEGVGKMSFALYVIHLPILIFWQQHFPWNGSWCNFCLGFVSLVTVVLMVAWYLDRRVQPFITPWLKGGNVAT